MTQETKAERKKRLARERQSNRRKRLRQHRQAVGARIFKMDMYAGTAADLEAIRLAGDFEQAEECLTLAIRGLAELARHNPAAFAELIRVR